MSNSLFKLTSLNLNGIRSATSKGLETWLHQAAPDCICVQEVKAQAADVAGKFETLAGMKGHFHFAEKKGYSGVAVYTRLEPSDVVIGFDGGEFDAEGRYVELRFDTPTQTLHHQRLLSQRLIRRGAPSRPSSVFWTRCTRTCSNSRQRDFILCGDINIAHQEADLKNWRSNQKNSGFTPESAPG
jgi:exodeoxyribonuclease-3